MNEAIEKENSRLVFFSHEIPNHTDKKRLSVKICVCSSSSNIEERLKNSLDVHGKEFDVNYETLQEKFSKEAKKLSYALAGMSCDWTNKAIIYHYREEAKEEVYKLFEKF